MVDGTLQTMELVANVETGSPTEKQATSYVHKSSGFMTRSEVWVDMKQKQEKASVLTLGLDF